MSRHGTHLHRPPAGPILAALLACLLFMPINAAAAEPVGRVLVATGSVTAEQEEASARSLGRRDPIYAGDRIRTAARARVQIRFEDGAMVDLDPSSTFEVEQYASDEDGGGSAVMNFLKGAMRTITGAIGGNRGDDYRMNTTVATIGVRGTAYALEYCDAECAGDDGQTGLFGRVDDGEVEVDGPGGTGGFTEGQYFFVPDGGAPARIVAPPEGILEGEGETGAGSDDDRIEDVSIRPLNTGDEDGIGLGGNDTDLLDPDFEGGDDAGLRPGESADVFFAGGFFGGEGGDVRGSAFILSPEDGDARLDSGAVVGAEFPNAGFVDASAASLVNTDSTTLGFGADEFDIDWGWWQGPVNVAGGRDDSSGTFVYAYTDPRNITTSAELTARADIGGTNFYGPSVGGTLSGPGGFDSNGGSWFLSEIGVAIDFANTVVTLNDFELTNSDTLDAFSMMSGNTTGSIDFADSSIEISGLADSNGTRAGDIWGKFVTDNADGLLLRFDISGDDEITGVAILEVGS